MKVFYDHESHKNEFIENILEASANSRRVSSLEIPFSPSAHLSTSILSSLLSGTIPVIFWGGFKDIEVHWSSRAYFEYTRGITASVTIVRCRPDGGKVLVEKGRVTLHAELMCTEDMMHVVLVKELVHDARTKCISGSSMLPAIVGFDAIKVDNYNRT